MPFCSGQYLAELLNLSRTAVWKHIRALQDAGVDIHAVRGKGYRLNSCFELLEEAKIRALVAKQQADLVSNIELFSYLPSTNDYLLKQTSIPAKSVVLAEEQTAGRGRRGRSWLAPAGSITLSLSWRFQRAQSSMPGLALAAAIAVIRAIKRQPAINTDHIKVKWPNDVVFKQQKLAGILVEMRGDALGPVDVVLGVGVNVDMPAHWQKKIDQPVASLSAVTNQAIERNRFAAALIVELARCCQTFEDAGFKAFHKVWNEYDPYLSRQVSLKIGETIETGVSEGVDDCGALLLRQGQVLRAFHSGEIEQSRFEQ